MHQYNMKCLKLYLIKIINNVFNTQCKNYNNLHKIPNFKTIFTCNAISCKKSMTQDKMDTLINKLFNSDEHTNEDDEKSETLDNNNDNNDNNNLADDADTIIVKHFYY